MISEKDLKKIKEKYPKGTKIKLINMEDDYGVPSGTLGKVDFIDDEGQIHMKWDNGSSLALIEGLDQFTIYEDDLFYERLSKIKKIFTTYMKKNNYSVLESVNNILIAVNKSDDKFIPYFELCCWRYPESYNINVNDRNGNFIIIGETVARYSIGIDSNDVITDDQLYDKFEEMLSDVFKKYSKYSKDNRLDFSFKNLEEDRQKYEIDKNNIKL